MKSKQAYYTPKLTAAVRKNSSHICINTFKIVSSKEPSALKPQTIVPIIYPAINFYKTAKLPPIFEQYNNTKPVAKHTQSLRGIPFLKSFSPSSPTARKEALQINNLIRECDNFSRKPSCFSLSEAEDQMYYTKKDLCNVIDIITSSRAKEPITYAEATDKLNKTKDCESIGVSSMETYEKLLVNNLHMFKKKKCHVWKVNATRMRRLTDKVC